MKLHLLLFTKRDMLDVKKKKIDTKKLIQLDHFFANSVIREDSRIYVFF